MIEHIRATLLGRVLVWIALTFAMSLCLSLIRNMLRTQSGIFRFLGRLSFAWVLSELARKTYKTYLFLLSAVIANLSLDLLTVKLSLILDNITLIFSGLQIIAWGSVLIESFIQGMIANRVDEGSKNPTANISRFILRLVWITFVTLLTLDNLGFNITTLVAGLGVGGVAVALAVQSILGDLFSSLTIVLDKPFRVGDFIASGDDFGTVESIGLKTTRVRAISGEQLIFPNSELLRVRVKNWQNQQTRRVLLQFSVGYDTDLQMLSQIGEWVKTIVSANSQVDFDRCHLFRFGNSTLDYELAYYVKSGDYKLHMDIQQRIILSIIEKFRNEKIQFAIPSQKLLFTAPVDGKPLEKRNPGPELNN